MLTSVQYSGNKKILKPSNLSPASLLWIFMILAIMFFFLYGILHEFLVASSMLNLLFGIYGLMVSAWFVKILCEAMYTVEVENDEVKQVYRLFGFVVYQRTTSLKNGYRFYTRRVRGGKFIYLKIEKTSIYIATSSNFDDIRQDKDRLRLILGKQELNPDSDS